MKDNDFWRILITPFLVVVGIAAVLYIFKSTMAAMATGAELEAMKELSGLAGGTIAMIGTLVGYIAGHSAGAVGKERADARASKAEKQSTAMLTAMKMEASTTMDKVKQAHPDLFP